jgi:hypothetical protein
MSDAFEIPDQLLISLAQTMERMSNAAALCRSDQQVLSAVPGCRVARYRDSEEQPFTSFESYVEVETRANRSITWWLEIWSRKEKWLVARAVYENRGPGQETLVSFSDQEFTSFSSFVDRIDFLTAELTDMVVGFQF